MAKVALRIDDRIVQAEQGAMLLDVCRQNGIHVPTLCHHPALGADGRCRLCLVELREGEWSKLVTACLYPVRDGLQVLTRSEPIRSARAMVLELLLARCPTSETIRKLAAEHGVLESRFAPDTEHGTCILCGLCVRVCAESIGVSAIGQARRGADKIIAAPFMERADACIGCGACAAVCPTGHIEMQESRGERRFDLFKVSFPLVACRECGKGFATRAHLEYLRRRVPLADYIFELCEDCKRRFYRARTLTLGHV